MEIQQEDNAAQATLNAPVYTANHVRFGAFLGGPLVAGYFIARNFEGFGEYGKAKAAWVYAIAATIVIFGGALLIPETANVPNYVIPIAYCWVAYYLVQRFQGSEIDAHVNAGRPVFGWGRVILIGFIGLAIIFAALFLIVIAVPV